MLIKLYKRGKVIREMCIPNPYPPDIFTLRVPPKMDFSQMMSPEFRPPLMGIERYKYTGACNYGCYIYEFIDEQEKVVKEITVDGRKYRLVEDENLIDLEEFKMVVDNFNHEIDLKYKGYHVLTIKKNGRFKLHTHVPKGTGLDVCAGGKILEVGK